MPRTNGTQSEQDAINRLGRVRRFTMNGKGLKVAGLVMGAFALMLTFMGIATGVIMYVAGKADNDDVAAVDVKIDAVKESVHAIDKRVEVMQTEQRMFIRAIRPDLPVGGD